MKFEVYVDKPASTHPNAALQLGAYDKLNHALKYVFALNDGLYRVVVEDTGSRRTILLVGNGWTYDGLHSRKSKSYEHFINDDAKSFYIHKQFLRKTTRKNEKRKTI